MDDKQRLRRPSTGVPVNLSLFPAEPSPHPDHPIRLRSSSTRPMPLLFPHIVAAWPSLLTRLGQRRRVLDCVLRAGHPLCLTGYTLTVAFPPDRQFHRELLDIPDYRVCVEQELAQTFHVKLTFITCLAPVSQELWRTKALRRSEQLPIWLQPDQQRPPLRGGSPFSQ